MEISPEQRIALEKHLDMVLKANEETNLTHILDKDEGRTLHIEDSLLGLPELMAAPAGKYADLGSGGGYPGIPLALVTDRQTTLVESVKKKAAYLERFVHELSLDDRVTVYPGRAEELAAVEPCAYAVITARALTALPSLIELASPLLKKGGQLICYKAEEVQEEIERAVQLEGKLGMHLMRQRTAQLEGTDIERSIVLFEKVGEPTVKLPRRPGMAQKRPYTS